MFICHLIIAVLVGKFGGRWANFAIEGWVAVAFLFFYMFSFGATWGPVPWAMVSSFPNSHIQQATDISLAFGNLPKFLAREGSCSVDLQQLAQ